MNLMLVPLALLLAFPVSAAEPEAVLVPRALLGEAAAEILELRAQNLALRSQLQGEKDVGVKCRMWETGYERSL